MRHFLPYNFQVRKGKGDYVYTDKGKLINFNGQVGVNLLGFDLPFFREKFFGNWCESKYEKELCNVMAKLTGYKNMVFGVTGSNACEMITQHYKGLGFDIFVPEGDFHGRSTDVKGTVKKITKPSKTVILFESIQGGAGDIKAKDKSFFSELKDFQKKGAILVADEIQFGLFRIGDLFSYRRYALKPDFVVISKGLAGYVPLSCVLSKKKFVPKWSTSYSNYNVGMRNALFRISYLLKNRKKIFMRVKENERYIFDKLGHLDGFLGFGNSFRFETKQITFNDLVKRGVLIENYHYGSVFKAHIPITTLKKNIVAGVNTILEVFHENKNK